MVEDMSIELKDILDYNVTLGALKNILKTLLVEGNVDLDFLREKVALNKFDLVSHSLSFLKRLQLVKLSGNKVISNISHKELNILRAIILNRLTMSNDPYVHYLIPFLDRFLSTKEYYEQKDVWHILAVTRFKENVKSPREELSFKLRILIRHLKELGLAITYKNFVIPVVDPLLVLEIIKHMGILEGSMYELLNIIKDKYLPCCDPYGKPYSPLVKAFEYLERLSFLKLSSKSDAGLEYSVGGKNCNFWEVLSLEY